jgi:lipopolysaccharide/colanic/teichoic acid biosynthesis glycosyltransferase
VAVLLLASPLLLFLAWLIKRDSPGNAFFVHDRVGLGDKRFRMYKLRTMEVTTPVYEFHPKSIQDPRLTKVGRWLRRLSLDELPQFANVLIGDMSLVGPRPEMPFIVEKYSEQERIRLRVKPGITGLWQISADRSRMIHENMDYDLFYIYNRGPLLDLIILLETCYSVLRGVGAR